MRILSILIITLVGCGGGEEQIDPVQAKMTKLCERAYSSTLDSLKDLYTQAGKDMPEMPAKDTYAAKCVSLGFSEEQAKCLDPKWSKGDPQGCKETMKPVEKKAIELGKLIKDAMTEGGKDENMGDDGDKKDKGK
jgi:hypothetical protein